MIDLLFYLVLPTGIYLFKIDNENKKAMCEIYVQS